MNTATKVQTLFFKKINPELLKNLNKLGIVLLREIKPLVFSAVMPAEVTPRMIFDTEVDVLGRDSKYEKIYGENYAAVTAVGPYIMTDEEQEKLNSHL